MAWKPKTVAGKLLKGAVIAGGSILGLAAGSNLVSSIAGNAVKAASTAKGTGALAKVGGVLSNFNLKVDKVKEGAANLLTGFTKEQRQIINKAKDEAKTEAQKLEVVEKLVSLGVDPAEARSQAGLSPAQLLTYDGEPVKATMLGMDNKTLLYLGGALAALFILPKLFKR